MICMCVCALKSANEGEGGVVAGGQVVCVVRMLVWLGRHGCLFFVRKCPRGAYKSVVISVKEPFQSN